MEPTLTPHCASCETKDYGHGKDCFSGAEEHQALYRMNVTPNYMVCLGDRGAPLLQGTSAERGHSFCQGIRLQQSWAGILRWPGR